MTGVDPRTNERSERRQAPGDPEAEAPLSARPEPEIPASGAPETRRESETPSGAPGARRDQEAESGALATRRGPADTRAWLRRVSELPLLVLFAFVIAVLIKTFLVQAFYIPSGSMQPTLDVGDRVLVEKLSYRVGEPKRGQVVVFARSVFGDPPEVPWNQDAVNFFKELLGLPTGREQDYIKRVVATGGDTLRYSGSARRLVVNGREVSEPYLGGRDRESSTIGPKDCKRLSMKRSVDGCRVPDGKVFVMGDNRPDSEDSRVLGPIDEDKIIGHAFLVLWPVRHFATL